MEEIINSIMQSPENTNPNVLRGQLEGLATGGSGATIVHRISNTLDITAGELFELCQNGVCFIETNLTYEPILRSNRVYRSKDSSTQLYFFTSNQTFSASGYDKYPQYSSGSGTTY